MTDFSNAFPQNNNPCGNVFNPQMPPNYNEATFCTPSPFWDADNKRMLAGLMNGMYPILQANIGVCKKPVTIGVARVTGKFFAIQFLSDSVLDVNPATGCTFAAQENGTFDPSALAGVTISKGTTMYLQFNDVRLVSGLAICYADPFRI